MTKKRHHGDYASRLMIVFALPTFWAAYFVIKFSHDDDTVASAVIPGVLLTNFGIFGFISLISDHLKYAVTNLPFKGRVTRADNPVAYWISFGIFSSLFLVAFVAGILFFTGVIHIDAYKSRHHW